MVVVSCGGKDTPVVINVVEGKEKKNKGQFCAHLRGLHDVLQRVLVNLSLVFTVSLAS